MGLSNRNRQALAHSVDAEASIVSLRSSTEDNKTSIKQGRSFDAAFVFLEMVVLVVLVLLVVFVLSLLLLLLEDVSLSFVTVTIVVVVLSKTSDKRHF